MMNPKVMCHMSLTDVKAYCEARIKFYGRYLECLNDYLPGSKELRAYYEGRKDTFQEVLTFCIEGEFLSSGLPFTEVEK